jgi:hypothetical protein
MTDRNQLDRRRHRGPLRFLHMTFTAFLKRYFGWDIARH